MFTNPLSSVLSILFGRFLVFLLLKAEFVYFLKIIIYKLVVLHLSTTLDIMQCLGLLLCLPVFKYGGFLLYSFCCLSHVNWFV